MGQKFKYSSSYTPKNYKAEFIISCLQLPKSRHREIPWAKEMKIMNSLTKKCEDPEFWFHARTDFAIPSLAWFLTVGGRKYLNEKYRIFKFKFSRLMQQPNLEKEKVEKDLDQDTLSAKKPKTLMDFLKKTS